MKPTYTKAKLFIKLFWSLIKTRDAKNFNNLNMDTFLKSLPCISQKLLKECLMVHFWLSVCVSWKFGTKGQAIILGRYQ